MNWYHGTKQISTVFRSDNCDKINDFIHFVRYFIEPTKVNSNNNHENKNKIKNNQKYQDTYPLESDELIMEYLAIHGYNVENAKFHLLCSLCVGKG